MNADSKDGQMIIDSAKYGNLYNPIRKNFYILKFSKIFFFVKFEIKAGNKHYGKLSFKYKL